jgi:hypothetical protein
MWHYIDSKKKPKSSTSEKKLEFSYRRNLDGLITWLATI